MKSLVFDAGPIISLSTNNLLWVLESLRKRFDGDFVLPMGVKREVVDRPLQTRKFKFEALQVQKLIDGGTFKVVRADDITKKGRELMKLANDIIIGHDCCIKIVQVGEIEVIAAALLSGSDTVVVDERVTRTLIEHPNRLKKLMERRLHTQLKINKKSLKKFVDITKHLRVIRSIELVTVAFELGILDDYIVKIPHARRELLESLLWGLKLNGASVSEAEIDAIVREQLKV